MASIPETPRPQFQPLSINTALSKLFTEVETIKLREGVKPHQAKRIKKAFVLLEQFSEPSSLRTGERRDYYKRFLKRISDDCGAQLVVICVVGLGQSAIASMREPTRLRLQVEIKKYEKALKCPILDRLAEEYRVKGKPSSGSDTKMTALPNVDNSRETQGLNAEQMCRTGRNQVPPLEGTCQPVISELSSWQPQDQLFNEVSNPLLSNFQSDVGEFQEQRTTHEHYQSQGQYGGALISIMKGSTSDL